MQCPIDQMELVMTERQGVEIDYCAKWLGHGELDKLIERSGAAEGSHGDRPNRQEEARRQYREPGHDQPRYKKRKSLLGELFDF